MDTQLSSPTKIKDKHFFNLQQLMNINLQLQHNAHFIDNNFEQQSPSSHEGKQKINIKDSRVFLIFGTMASGKTMVQYYFCQDKLVHGIEESKKLPYIIPENVYQNALIEKTPSTITTRIPNIRSFIKQKEQKSQTQLTNEQIIFIQVPDIKQLKPQQQTILISFLQRVFKQCTKLHLLLVIEQQTLCDMGQMIQSFQCITELFDIKQQQIRTKISECLSIIVNKVTQGSEDSDIKGSLQQVNDQVIAQQSQQLSEVIKTILNKDRVYIIRNTQPQMKQQKQLLQAMIKQSQFRSFGQIQMSGDLLNDIITSEQVVQDIVEKLQLRRIWENNVSQLNKVIVWLVGTKINSQQQQQQKQQKQQTQESQQKQQLIEQIKSLINSQLSNLQKSYPYLQKINNINQSSLFNSKHKKLNQKIMSSLQALIKIIININLNINNDSQQQQATIYYQHIQLILEALRQIELCVRKQIDQINQPFDLQNTDVLYSLISHRLLFKFTTNLQVILFYIINVLNHNLDENQTTKQQQKQFNKNCLIQLSKQLLQNLKTTFINFDLSLLATSKKNKKSPHKKIKQSNKVLIKKPNLSILQLKQQFINEIKSTKRNFNLMDEIIALPVSHFKLYLLVEQYKQLLQNVDNNNEQSNYLTFMIVIKQIASILHFYQLFIQQIKFLLIIPDWNRISIAVDTIERYQQQKKQNYADQKQILFLNKLSIWAKQKRLMKLSQKIFKVVDDFISVNKMKKSGLDPKPYINERENHAQLDENWFESFLKQEHTNQDVEQKRPFLPLIEKAKKYEQKNQQKINKFNQEMYLMKQRLNK